MKILVEIGDSSTIVRRNLFSDLSTALNAILRFHHFYTITMMSSTPMAIAECMYMLHQIYPAQSLLHIFIYAIESGILRWTIVHFKFNVAIRSIKSTSFTTFRPSYGHLRHDIQIMRVLTRHMWIYYTWGASFVTQYVKKHHVKDDQPQFITQNQNIFLPKSTCNNQPSGGPMTTKE